MKIENDFFYFKMATGPKPEHGRGAQCAVACLGPATGLNRLGLAQPMACEAGPCGMTPVRAQRTHGVTRLVRGALRARDVARLMVAHQRLIGGNAAHGCGPIV
jgi:hypothetical protein